MTALNITLAVLCFVGFGLGYFAHMCKTKEPRGSSDAGITLLANVIKERDQLAQNLKYMSESRARAEERTTNAITERYKAERALKDEQERNAVLSSSLVALNTERQLLRSTLLNIIDNLNDLPVNQDWATKTVEQLEEFTK